MTYEIVLAGFGGQGILFLGKMIALAGMIDDALLVYRTGDTPPDVRPEDVASVLALPLEEE